MENQTENQIIESVKDEFNEKTILNRNIKRIMIGLSEIGNLDIEDFKTSYGITRTIANLSQTEKAYDKCVSALRNSYFKKNEKNEFVTENGQYVFKDDVDNQFSSKAEALDDTVVDAKVFTMKASELQKVKGLKATSMAKCHELIVDDVEL